MSDKGIVVDKARSQQYEEANLDIDWEKKRVGDIFNKIKSGGTPKRGKEKYWKDGNIPFVKIEDLNR